MRLCPLSLCLFVIAGCGSGDEEPVPQAAGVTLSLGNPAAEQTKPTGTADLDPEQKQAVEQLIASALQAHRNRQTGQAVEALSQAIGIDPSDSRLFRMRGNVYAAAGELASARADFSAAILNDPANAELHNVRGYFLMTNGVTADALKDFATAVKLDPGLAVAWNNRGLVYLQQGDYEDALKQFREAVDVDPEYADAWNNIGFVLMKQDKLDEALPKIEQALKLNPEYIAAWNNRGLINLQSKNYEAACTAFTKAIEHADLDPRWYSHRLVALQELKRFDEAAADQRMIAWIGRLTELNQNLNRDMKDAARWIARGDCLAEGERYAAAVRDYTNALQIEPANTDALNARARIHAMTGELQKAMDDCEQSIFIRPTIEALSIRGDAWLAMGNLDQAIDDFESAQRMDEVIADAYRRRAEQHSSKGNQTAAEEDLKAATRIEDALAGRLQADNTEPIPFPDGE